MIDLSKRSSEEEIMDDLSDNSQSLYRALKELDIINKWLGGNAITINAMKNLLIGDRKKVWHIADLGCGSGEMLRKIVEIARKLDVTVVCIGFDANTNVVKYAQDHCIGYPEISFASENILEHEFKNRHFDVILCTLFLHHFDENTLIDLFQQFKNQSKKVIINDLHRHWFAYYSIKWITKVFSKSSMVQNDACLSVWRAFTKSELKSILNKANINTYHLNWRWAFRWRLIIE